MPAVFRILIVEDNPHVVEMFSYALRKMASVELKGKVSLDLEVATNGAEALERMRKSAFSLVLTDVYMPVMDGLQLLERIRGELHLDTLPVIVFSGGDDAKLRALDAGADVFLRKPVRFTEISDTVRRLLNLAA